MLRRPDWQKVTRVLSFGSSSWWKSTLSPVAPRDLKAELAARPDAVVLDVRTPGEFETEHIAGSYNVPLDLLQEHADEVAARLDGTAVLVCQSGSRAGTAQDRLAQAGFTSARVLQGGISAYAEAGGEVVRSGNRWSMDRQVRMVAGSLVLASVVGGQLVSPKLRAVAAGVGGGLAYSALSNTCAMANVLSKMPWNQGAKDPSKDAVLEQLTAQ